MKYVFAIILAISVTNALAVTRCERNRDGSMCCWDTNTEGPFKPLSCY